MVKHYIRTWASLKIFLSQSLYSHSLTHSVILDNQSKHTNQEINHPNYESTHPQNKYASTNSVSLLASNRVRFQLPFFFLNPNEMTSQDSGAEIYTRNYKKESNTSFWGWRCI